MKQPKIYLASQYAKIRKNTTWLKCEKFDGSEWKKGYVVGGEGIYPKHFGKRRLAEFYLSQLS